MLTTLYWALAAPIPLVGLFLKLRRSLILISGGIPTYISRLNQLPLVIDFTFVSSSLYPESSWISFGDNLNSDHIPAIISINKPIKTKSFFSHKINLTKMDWKEFFRHLIRSYPHLLSLVNNPELDSIQKYETFVTFVKNSILRFVPSKKPLSIKKRSPPPLLRHEKRNVLWLQPQENRSSHFIADTLPIKTF